MEFVPRTSSGTINSSNASLSIRSTLTVSENAYQVQSREKNMVANIQNSGQHKICTGEGGGIVREVCIMHHQHFWV